MELTLTAFVTLLRVSNTRRAAVCISCEFFYIFMANLEFCFACSAITFSSFLRNAEEATHTVDQETRKGSRDTLMHFFVKRKDLLSVFVIVTQEKAARGTQEQ